MQAYVTDTLPVWWRSCVQVGVKKVPGGSVTDSFLVQGVAFKKTFSYAGFEQMCKKFVNPKILLLNVELELKVQSVLAHGVGLALPSTPCMDAP